MPCFKFTFKTIALLSLSIFLVSGQSIQCNTADDDGVALTSPGTTDGGGLFTCTYRGGAGSCTYFMDGSFSSGSSDCPPQDEQPGGAATTAATETTEAPPPATTTAAPPPETTSEAPTTTSGFVTTRTTTSTASTPTGTGVTGNTAGDTDGAFSIRTGMGMFTVLGSVLLGVFLV